jgi:hypothetical protein
MTAPVNSKINEPRIGKTFKEDWRNVKFKDDIGGEYKELKEYFLSDERKDKLHSRSKTTTHSGFDFYDSGSKIF